jgi:REP element-mobilizing transposase RayT
MPQLTITRRNLPHWFTEGATYYVTFRVKAGSLNEDEIRLILDHIRSGDQRFYQLMAACIMPDHVHVILAPNADLSLSDVMRGIKGVTARKINSLRRTLGALWQDESWDRILRGEEELMEKLNYMLMNPVKAGIAEDPWSYHGWFLNI